MTTAQINLGLATVTITTTWEQGRTIRSLGWTMATAVVWTGAIVVGAWLGAC
jgi:hypothetical protein